MRSNYTLNSKFKCEIIKEELRRIFVRENKNLLLIIPIVENNININ